MLRSSKRTSRGFTVSEMLSTLVILALFGSFVAVIIAPILKAPSQQQAKADTLQAAAQGVYQVQRDMRMSDITGIYACSSSGGTYSCSQPSSSTSASYLVMLSPLSNGQLYWDTATGSTTLGLPLWQGTIVYWLNPNNSGSNDLERSFVSTSLLGSLGVGPHTSSLASTFANAISDATSSGGQSVAHGVQSLKVFVNSSQHVVGLTVQALSTNGASTNSTTYVSNTYVRN